MSECRVLGVIPARGGSKRVQRKNVREVGGRPLIAHTIDHAKESDRLDKVIVSTEDPEIRNVAERFGGEVPFKRPDELASDTATNNQVVRHALDWFDDRGQQFDIVCLLLATAPFRSPKDIDKAIDMVTESEAQSAVGVTEFEMPPFYAVETDDRGYLSPYFGEDYLWSKTRTQEVPELKHPNGAIFTAETEAFYEYENFFTERTVGYRMPPERSIDIDEPFDLRVARALIEGDAA